MVYCCVPFCKAKKGKTKDVSFHEFPSNEEVKKNWIKNISRGTTDAKTAWIPSELSYVCSQHFKQEDFKEGLKIKKLKTGVVPTIFKDYPEYMQENLQKQARKRPLPNRQKLPHSSKKLRFNSDINISLTKVPASDNHADVIPVELQESPSLNGKSASKTMCSKHPVLFNAKKKLRACQVQVCRLKKKIQILQKEVKILKNEMEENLIKTLKKIENDAKTGNVRAAFLMEQIKAYGTRFHTFSAHVIRYCIIWRMQSPKGYEFPRKSNLMHLPSRSTLKRYVGCITGEIGVTSLIKQRLSMVYKQLQPMERYGSIIFDKMAIKPMKKYVVSRDQLVGSVDLGMPELGIKDAIANRLLCFVYKGLSTKISIPVAYYFTKQLLGKQLHKIILEVIQAIEDIGFSVVRIVCDNSRVNTVALNMLCGGSCSPVITHPVNPKRPLFISYDYCHIIKNVRSLFLDPKRHLENQGKAISNGYLKTLYKLQENAIVKPVRFLSRKHVFPSNFEKMNVQRAHQLISLPVRAALLYMEKRVPHLGFENVGETVKFMEYMHKWFELHDVSNTSHYMRARNRNKSHYWMLDDERLEWLENDFIPYLEAWKSSCTQKYQFLSEETYQALKLTTYSTVQCIRYLIAEGFHFVLTRNFSSDDIEMLFSGLRQMLGGNDMTNAVRVIAALENLLKAGIISPSLNSNIQTEVIHELFPFSEFCKAIAVS